MERTRSNTKPGKKTAKNMPKSSPDSRKPEVLSNQSCAGSNADALMEQIRRLEGENERLRKGARQQDMLFDHSLDMLCIVGFDSRFERVSASFGTVLGCEEHELLSRPFLDFLHPDDHEPMRRALKLQKTSRKAKSFETRCKCSDGTYKWISWHVHTLLSEKLIVAVGRDITDRRATKEALRRSEALARTFLDLPLDVSLLMDREGILIDFNDHLPKRLGRSREEIVGRCIFDLLPPDVGKARRAKAAELLRTGGVMRFEDRNGEFWYDSIVYPVLDEGGEIEKIAVLSYDITQRKNVEEALRESEALARALLNTPEDNVVVLLDTEGRILDLNDNLPRRLAMSKGGIEREPTREELVGREAVSFLSEEVARLRREKIKQVAATGKPVRFEDCDSGVWYDNVIYPVMDDAKRVTKIAVFAYDISPIKKAEEEVRRLNEELEQKVADRTAELLSLNEMLTQDIAHRVKIEAELRARTDELYESNTTLKVLLDQRNRDRQEMEQKIVSNIKHLVLPYLETLSGMSLPAHQKTLVSTMKENMDKVVSPFLTNLQYHFSHFTPAELRVAGFIRDGRTVKEIANILGISESAVNSHRQHIRNKLGLRNEKINLKTRLRSLGDMPGSD